MTLDSHVPGVDFSGPIYLVAHHGHHLGLPWGATEIMEGRRK